MRTKQILRSFVARAVLAPAVGLISVVTVVLPAESASAAPTQVCFEKGNPRWDAMRAMTDQFIKDGTLAEATGEAYKCDPRLATSNMAVKVTRLPATGFQTLSGCRSTGGIQVELGFPVALVTRQTLEWCWNGTTVSNWTGACDGWPTGWGSVNFWTYEGCTSNDFIQYSLNGNFPGGIHHYTKMLFENSLTWVSISQATSTWGHFDGTSDYQVH